MCDGLSILVQLTGAPKMDPATKLSTTCRRSRSVLCQLPSCQSGVHDLPQALSAVSVGFPDIILTSPCSYNHSSLSSAGLAELGPVLNCGYLHLLPSTYILHLLDEGSMMTVRVVTNLIPGEEGQFRHPLHYG